MISIFSAFKTGRLFILAIIIFFTLVSIYGINEFSFNDDEIFSIIVASKSIPDQIEFLKNKISPPLYYMLITSPLMAKEWIGYNYEFWARLLSVVAAVLSIWIFWKYALCWLEEKWAILSTIIYSTSNILLYYSNYARFYALMILISLASFYLLEKYIRANNKWWLAAFIFISACGIYVHYFTALILFAQFIYLISYKIRNNSKDIREYYFIFIGLMILLISILPLTFIFIGQVSRAAKHTDFLSFVIKRIRTLVDIYYHFSGAEDPSKLLRLSGIISWLLSFYGFVNAKKGFRGLQAISIALFIIFAIVMMLPRINYGARYFISAYPIFVLMLTIGIKELSMKYRGWQQRLSILVLMLLVVSPSLWNNYNYLFNEKSALSGFDAKRFISGHQEALSKRPILILNFKGTYLSDKTAIGKHVLFYYYYGKLPLDTYQNDVFLQRIQLAEVYNYNTSWEANNNVITMMIDCQYPPRASLARRAEEYGWERFSDKLFVKAWPTPVTIRNIIDEIDAIGFPCQLGN